MKLLSPFGSPLTTVVTIAMSTQIFLACGPSQIDSLAKGEVVTTCPDELPIGIEDLGDQFLRECKLTPYWALEYVGSDLAKRFVGSIEGLTESSAGVIDSGYFPENLRSKIREDTIFKIDTNDQSLFYPDHSKMVANLMFHPTLGSSQNSYVGAFIAFGGDPLLRETAETLKDSNTSVINLSVVLENSERPVPYINALIENGKTLVFASGNNYPHEQEIPLSNSKILNVGAVDPTGMVSVYSLQSDYVDILAPSGFEILTTSDNEEYELFNGTSAAAPLVSGIVADLKSILPRLTPAEVEYLVKRTAIPLTSNITGQNGSGMINAYKLMRVADRIRNSLMADESFDLQNDSFYDFSEEAKGLLLLADDLDQSSSGMKQALIAARKSLLLDLTSKAARAVGSRYFEMGYETNAKFYSTLANVTPKMFFRFHENFDDRFTDYVFLNQPQLDDVKKGKLYRFSSRFSEDSKIYQHALKNIQKLATSGSVTDLRDAMRFSYLLERDGTEVLRNSGLDDIKGLWDEAVVIEMDLVEASGYQWNKIEAAFKFSNSQYQSVRRVFYDMTPWNLSLYSQKVLEI